MQRWSGRTALVTGASLGIGKGVSAALIKHGVNVIGCARNLEKLKESAASMKGPGTFVPVKCDVTKEGDIIEMFKVAKEKFNGIDICVNNVGFSALLNSSLLEGSTDNWKTMLDVNVLGLSICTREAVKSMKEKGINDGHIINIGSVFGHLILQKGGEPHNFYCATKFAVRALTEGTRNEVRSIGKNFRVTHISPGLTDTEALKPLGEEMIKQIFARRRPLQVEDIAESVVYVLGTPPHVQITELMIDNTDPLL